MTRTTTPRPIEVAAASDGTLTYLVALPPEALPAVSARDIAAAWDEARAAAIGEAWGERRRFRFRRAGGGFTDLALLDRDACCWARAIDARADMRHPYGLSLCLRLLALVDLLGRVPWAAGLVRLARDGATLHPAALDAAATLPLTEEARFDDTAVRDRLRPLATLGPSIPEPASPLPPAGARA